MKRFVIPGVLFILLFMPAALAQVVSISPSSQTVKVGNDAQVRIMISGVTDIYGFQFDIEYNGTQMDFGLMQEGSFLNNGGADSTFCVTPDASTDGFVRNYGCTRSGEASGISGSGILAILNLSTNPAIGTSNVMITNLKLSDIDTNEISGSVTNGQVTIAFCSAGETKDCSPCGSSYDGIGECHNGYYECIGGEFTGPCLDYVCPSAETCDGLDNDCNAVYDDNCDGDDDNYCNSSMTRESPYICDNAGSWCCSLGGNDCDDSDPLINPGAAEICDGVSNNCGASPDIGCDDDDDDYCDSAFTRESPYSCSGGSWCCPLGGNDCLDMNSAVNPGGTEICDNLNNDCDASTDEGCDDDNDNYCDDTIAFSGSPATCPNGPGDCDDDPGQCGSSCNPGNSNDVCPYTSWDEDCDGLDEYKGDTNVLSSGSACDGCVDGTDLTLIGLHFGEVPADSSWEAGVDLKADSSINIFDLVMVGANFGKSYDGGCP